MCNPFYPNHFTNHDTDRADSLDYQTLIISFTKLRRRKIRTRGRWGCRKDS